MPSVRFLESSTGDCGLAKATKIKSKAASLKYIIFEVKKPLSELPNPDTRRRDENLKAEGLCLLFIKKAPKRIKGIRTRIHGSWKIIS